MEANSHVSVQHGEPSAPTSAFVSAASITPRSIAWLWQGYLPLGSHVVLDGDPGLGKSTLVYDLAARVTQGHTMPDGSPSVGPSAVVIASAEDDPETVVVPRLIAAGADLAKVQLPRAEEAMQLDPAWLADLEAVVVEHDARLVTIDPLFAFIPSRVDAHRDADIRSVLGPVARLAQRTGACVLLVRHPNKAVGMSALHRGGGSIGIVGSARAAFLLAPDPNGTDPTRRIFAPVKMNVAARPQALDLRLLSTPNGAPRIAWGGPIDITADDLVRQPSRAAPSREHAEAFLTDALAHGPVASRHLVDLAAEEGISPITLRRAKERLGIISRRIGGSDGHHECSLPDPAPREQP